MQAVWSKNRGHPFTFAFTFACSKLSPTVSINTFSCSDLKPSPKTT